RTSPFDASQIRVASSVELDRIAPVLAHSTALLIERAGACWQDAVYMSDTDRAAAVPVRTWGVPLFQGGRTTGVFVLTVPESVGAPIDDRISELLQLLSPAVAIALNNAQLFARHRVRAN